MTTQYAEQVVQAAHVVHDEVWFRYWREGKRELRPDQVINSIRQVRVKARINEDEMPAELLGLLRESRSAADEKGMIKLVELIQALKMVFLPSRPGAA